MQISEENLTTLLIFLKIDVVSREALVKRVFKNQNFDDLVDFLITLECTVKKNLVLTDALMFYFEALEKETPSMKEIEEQVNSILDLTRLELESFNIFSMHGH